MSNFKNKFLWPKNISAKTFFTIIFLVILLATVLTSIIALANGKQGNVFIDGEQIAIDSKVRAADDTAYFPTDWKTTVNTKTGVSSANITSIGFASDKPNGYTNTNSFVDSDNKIAIYKNDTDIQFYSSSKIYGVAGDNSYFSGCTALTTVTFTNFNTSEMTSFDSLFYNCKKLKTINWPSNFDTSNITTMRSMFYYCSALESLNLSSFVTSKVTAMNKMFAYCSSLKSLDVSNFNTSSVKNMQLMFQSCQALTELDLSSFNTSNVTEMSMMFYSCSKLETLNLSGWVVNITTGTSKLDLSGLSSLRKITLPQSISTTLSIPSSCTWYNTSDSLSPITKTVPTYSSSSNSQYVNAKIVSSATTATFPTDWKDTVKSKTGVSYSDITSIQFVSKFPDTNEWTYCEFVDTNELIIIYQNGTDIRFYSPEIIYGSPDRNIKYFYSCSALASIDFSNFDTSKMTDMSFMFYACSKLTTLDLGDLNTSSVTTLNSVFSSCSGLTDVNISGWDTSKVTDISLFFYSCFKLTTLDLNELNTSNVTSMNSTFGSCSGLTDLNVSGWDTSKVNSMNAMFYNCPKLSTLDVGNWVTSSVTSMSSMFASCYGLSTLEIVEWDTSKVTSMSAMFYNCGKLSTLEIGGWNTSKVTNMSSMFASCYGLSTLDLGGWDTTSVTNVDWMFSGCSKLATLDLSGWTLGDGANLDLSSVTSLKTIILPNKINTTLQIPKNYSWYNKTNGNTVVENPIPAYAEGEAYSEAEIKVGFAITLIAKGATCTERNDWLDNGDYTYSKVVWYGETLGELPKVKRTGYTFINWNSNSKGEGITYTSSSVINSSLTIYAVWIDYALTVTSDYSNADSFAMAFAQVTGNGSTWNLMLVNGEDFIISDLAEGTYTVVASSTINHSATVQNGTITLGGSTTKGTTVVEVTKVSASGFYGATIISSTVSSSLNAENNVQSIEIPQLIETETYQSEEETRIVQISNVKSTQATTRIVQTSNFENTQDTTAETNVVSEKTSNKEMQVVNLVEEEIFEDKKIFSELD